ncbi:Arf-GAP with GTPase, ANK repeat and PH domain-containing protein 3 [Holothuria leucospilota]|uniref:Arf-GAP with GTPase, ANK repeat and PH domain-containing protein 3 n=1 Tax=Holothuria leucospilota TaxID=206669 RepID=A0A9Q1H8F1_HOLLE|nr:Arf-GAP with GTPase, ANK repeat and PH domain-containing protein 3 [Holothuria leucospilota]
MDKLSVIRRHRRSGFFKVRQEKCMSDIGFGTYDAFVNSQEWTLSRTVPELKLGVVGSITSGKSALVHRYLTGSYMQEESPEGGRFKKEILVDDRSHLLLIRDEGSAPELQFCSWVDAVILVFSVEDERSFHMLYNFYAKLAHYRNTADLPIILVGTQVFGNISLQDAVSQTSPRVIDDTQTKKLAASLKNCCYYETCAMYGLNVDRVFQDAAHMIVERRHQQQQMYSLANSSGSLPSTPHSSRSHPFGPFPPPGQGHYHHHSSNHSNSQHVHPPTPSGVRKTRDESGKDGGGSGGGGGGVTGRDGPMQTSPTSTPNFARKSRRKSNIFTPSKSKPQNEEKKNGETVNTSQQAPQHVVGSGRSIPIKQGLLHKRSSKALNKEWKKKYVTLCDDGTLRYHPSLHDYMSDVHGKEIKVLNTTVKVPGRRPQLAKASPQSGNDKGANGATNKTMKPAARSSKESFNFKTNSTDAWMPREGGLLTPKERQEAVAKSTSLPRDSNFDALVISNSVQTGVANGGFEAPAISFPQMGNLVSGKESKKKHRRMRSSAGSKLDNQNMDGKSDEYEFILHSLDNRQWHFAATSAEERDSWVSVIEQQILASLQTNESTKSKSNPNSTEQLAAVEAIRKVPGNGFCVDCGTKDPDWASLNLGVLVCIECSGIHRNLGSHISRVRSLTLDEWPPELTAVMLCIGNHVANSIWEANLNNRSKPTPQSSREEKEKWIRAKYDNKEFIAERPHPDKPVGPILMDAVSQEEVRSVLLLLAHATPEDINCTYGDGDGRTALHLSCAMANCVITQLLTWYNIDVNSKDGDGRSALSYAHCVGADECAKVLLASGCTEDKECNTNMNNSSIMHRPPLLPPPRNKGRSMNSII